MAIKRGTETVDPSKLLNGFTAPINAVVVGAAGGIGGAVLQQVAQCPHVANVLALSRQPDDSGGKVIHHNLDITDDASVARAADLAKEKFGVVHLVFVATGLLHDDDVQPEKALRQLDVDAMARAFAVNATGPSLVAKYFAPLLPRQGKSVFAAISARVGSIADNGLGGWYAYRASKAALNQLIRTTAIEIARKHPDAVFLSLHPGTTDTKLSQPFQAGVPDNKLFTPHYSANRMLQVITQATPADSGKLIAWDGEMLPY